MRAKQLWTDRMSMELIAVLPGSDPPDQRQWQMALVRLGLPWRFEVSCDPAAAKGFCPMRAGKVVSGVEILNDTLDALPSHPLLDGPHRVIAFRWDGDMLECACALAAAAALPRAPRRRSGRRGSGVGRCGGRGHS